MKKRVLSVLLSIILMIGIVPSFSVVSHAEYYSDSQLANIRNSVISNSGASESVNRKMLYYLKNVERLKTSNLDVGKSVVFLFDGCSDNVFASGFDYTSNHMTAYCAVVKLVNGVPTIVYENENSSTIPDNPRYVANNTAGNSGTDVPTVVDGIHNITKTNHQSKYAALHVADSGSSVNVIRCNSSTYYSSESSGINIHARGWNYVDRTTYSSTGCFNIGTASSWGEYNDFMCAVTGISNAKSNKFSSTGADVGVVVVDRYMYRGTLSSIYNDSALVDTITAYSIEAASNAINPPPKPTVYINGTDYCAIGAGNSITYTFNAPDATSLHLYIYKDTDKIFEGEYSPGGSYSRVFDTPGHYSCYIISHNSGGSTASDWKGWDVAARPGQPTLTVRGSSTYDNVYFNWNSTSGTSWYDLRIYDSTRSTQLQYIPNIYTNYYSLSLPQGSYIANLCSVLDGYYECWTASADVPFTVSAEATASPAKVAYHNNHIYELYYDNLTWEEAKNYCESYRGGHLATINDADEQAFIENELLTDHLNGYYLGATDKASEGTWTWVTGEPFDYTNWSAGQPDNYTQINPDGECYLILYSDGGKWNDYYYDTHQKGFICEIETESYEPVSTVSFDGHIYKLYDYNISFGEAEHFCRWQGGHLASITSEAEQAAVYGLLISSGCEKNLCWLGADSPERDGVWSWTDGSDFSYSNWAANQPDTYQGTESCLMIYRTDGTWNDLDWDYCCKNKDSMCFILEMENPDWSYTVTDGKATITHYNGSAAEVTIPSSIDGYSVTAIGTEAFNECESLTSIIIPDSVTTINNEAFWKCTSLTRVQIGSSVTVINKAAFEYCESLASIEVSGDNQTYSSIDGILYSKDGKSLYLCPEGKTTVVIPEGVSTITSGAFRYCEWLTSVTIPDSVTEIGNNAFYMCSSLTGVVIPESVTTIGSGSFYKCASLTSVAIPDGVMAIKGSTFSGCSLLTSVTIPKSVTTIGGAVFENCTSLNKVVFRGTEEQWNDITIGLYNDPLLNAEIEFGGALPGDLDGDNCITSDDAIYLLFHTFFSDEYPIKQDCDFNGDGEVTSDDAIYLLFHTFFADEYPLGQ